MESKVENQANTNNLPNILDAVSVAGAVGGAVASLVTQQVMFAALPLSLSVALNVFNRRQTMNEVMEKMQQQEGAIALIPKFGNNQKILAEQLQQLQQFQKASEENQKVTSVTIVDLTQAGRDNQKSFETLAQQVQEVEAKQNQMGETVEELQKTASSAQAICSANPNSADFYFQRGLTSERDGNTQKAIGDYTQAIRLDANFAPAYEHRGMIYAATGSKKAAVEDLRKASMLYFEQGDIESYEKTRNATKEIHSLPSANSVGAHQHFENLVAGSLFE